jgi:hypothetical protein
MTTRRALLSRPATPPSGWPSIWPSQPTPQTNGEFLERIEALARSIQSHVQFISQVGDLKGTSAEAKEKAVAAFHGRMAEVERQLGLITESLKLG